MFANYPKLCAFLFILFIYYSDFTKQSILFTKILEKVMITISSLQWHLPKKVADFRSLPLRHALLFSTHSPRSAFEASLGCIHSRCGKLRRSKGIAVPPQCSSLHKPQTAKYWQCK